MGGKYPNGLNEEIFLEDVSSPNSIPDDDVVARTKELIYPYNVKLFKMYSVLLSKRTDEYKAVVEKHKYLSKTGQLFKMNLYPLAFGNSKEDLWGEAHFKLTGIPTKTIYRAWCQEHRFKQIHNWVTESNPKAIICTGVSLLQEFVMAFCGFENIYSDFEPLQEVKTDDKTRYFYWMPINHGKSLLFITPFFGNRYGLNEDEHFEDIGSKIREICVNFHGCTWLK